MKVFCKVDGEMQVYECSGRDMRAARTEVANIAKTRGAILIDVASIPPAPPILLSHYGPHFGVSASPIFRGNP